MSEFIDAAVFSRMIICANAALQSNTAMIDELNVFPVPDGDTGTNMGLTFANAAAELNKKSFSSIGAAADCVASALLRAARGNSGVILSLLFRGFSKHLKGMDTASTTDFAEAMCAGVDAAYKAVMKPAEGTILTVSRLAAASAKKAAEVGATFDSMLECSVVSGEETLADTINLNPVLKKAGVVDAGGKGYMVILNAMLESYRGTFVMPEYVSGAEKEKNSFEIFDTEDITFAFDTVFIVRKNTAETDLLHFRAYLESIGDSLVIGEDDEVFKVHVHTNTPGDALNEAQKYGTLELAKIENMRIQHDDVAAGRKAISTDDLEAVEQELENPAVAAPEKEYGTVSVCAGAGLEEIFKELGTDRIVTGGQTMNPSTDDILKEINLVPASTVFVFPNNKNIIMAAQQCIPLTEKKVVVVPTKTVPQGISAMLNFDVSLSEEELLSQLTESISGVHTAMVTYAARDSEFDGHSIHSGEYLALLDGALIGSYTGIPTLFKELSWAIDELNPEYISVYYGESVTVQEAQSAVDNMAGNFPDAELSIINGGQPVYYYIISIE